MIFHLQICRIENISHLSELRVLNLAGNNISAVENLKGLDCLTELNLRHNSISFVVSSLFSTQLKSFYPLHACCTPVIQGKRHQLFSKYNLIFIIFQHLKVQIVTNMI